MRCIHNKSQAPEDECTNIRNMLSSKQCNNKASDIKLVYLYFNYQDDTRSNKLKIPQLVKMNRNFMEPEGSLHFSPYCEPDDPTARAPILFMKGTF